MVMNLHICRLRKRSSKRLDAETVSWSSEVEESGEDLQTYSPQLSVVHLFNSALSQQTPLSVPGFEDATGHAEFPVPEAFWQHPV